jgi:hypothetical protein
MRKISIDRGTYFARLLKYLNFDNLFEHLVRNDIIHYSGNQLIEKTNSFPVRGMAVCFSSRFLTSRF